MQAMQASTMQINKVYKRWPTDPSAAYRKSEVLYRELRRPPFLKAAKRVSRSAAWCEQYDRAYSGSSWTPQLGESLLSKKDIWVSLVRVNAKLHRSRWSGTTYDRMMPVCGTGGGLEPCEMRFWGYCRPVISFFLFYLFISISLTFRIFP